jgi:hypothetical protein
MLAYVVFAFLIVLTVLESIFYLVFRCYLVPMANHRTEPQPYRDYAQGERHKFVLNILDRIAQQTSHSDHTGGSMEQAIGDFLFSWFARKHPDKDIAGGRICLPLRFRTIRTGNSENVSDSTATHSNDSSSSESRVLFLQQDESSSRSLWTIKGLGKYDLECLFAWAEFNKDVPNLTE